MEDVKVHEKFLVGEEGLGALYLIHNLNRERFTIAVGVARTCRICYSECVREMTTRRTFGKKLYEHQAVRIKLAEMARQIEALQAFVDSVAFMFKSGVKDADVGAQCVRGEGAARIRPKR